MIYMIKKIKSEEGFQGFFRGTTLQVFRTTIGYSFFFTNLENMNQIKNDNLKNNFFIKNQNMLNFTNAAISKTIANIICSPITVLTTRFQVIGNNIDQKIFQSFIQIYKNEGIQGYFRGLFYTIIRDAPFQGIQYTFYKKALSTYENMNNVTSKDDKLAIGIAGGFSSSIAILLTYPLDNIRTRCQFMRGEHYSCFQILKKVYQDEGIQGFYQGYIPRLLKKAFSGTVIWSIYENSKSQQKNQ